MQNKQNKDKVVSAIQRLGLTAHLFLNSIEQYKELSKLAPALTQAIAPSMKAAKSSLELFLKNLISKCTPSTVNRAVISQSFAISSSLGNKGLDAILSVEGTYPLQSSFIENEIKHLLVKAAIKDKYRLWTPDEISVMDKYEALGERNLEHIKEENGGSWESKYAQKPMSFDIVVDILDRVFCQEKHFTRQLYNADSNVGRIARYTSKEDKSFSLCVTEEYRNKNREDEYFDIKVEIYNSVSFVTKTYVTSMHPANLYDFLRAYFDITIVDFENHEETLYGYQDFLLEILKNFSNEQNI